MVYSPFKKKLNALLIKFQRVSATDKIFFSQYMLVMLKAGISLSKAFETLSIQTKNKKFAEILLDLHDRIEKGESLTNALENYKHIFGQLFISMIRSGEISGKLEQVLEQLYMQIKKNHTLITKVRNALIYPVVILVAMSGIGAGMMIFVVPKIMDVFKEVNAELPLMTKVLIKFSDIVSQHGIIFGASLILAIALIIKFIKTKIGKRIFDAILLKMPIISPIVRKINSARFARTMASLLRTDISIVESFRITADITGNVFFKDAFLHIAEDVKKGLSIKDSMNKHMSVFPPVILQMVAIGEETGTLDNTLEEMATFYEEQVYEVMNNLPSIIEPILMLLLGGAVGFMAMAIIMPMYSLTQQV